MEQGAEEGFTTRNYTVCVVNCIAQLEKECDNMLQDHTITRSGQTCVEERIPWGEQNTLSITARAEYNIAQQT